MDDEELIEKLRLVAPLLGSREASCLVIARKLERWQAAPEKETEALRASLRAEGITREQDVEGYVLRSRESARSIARKLLDGANVGRA